MVIVMTTDTKDNIYRPNWEIFVGDRNIVSTPKRLLSSLSYPIKVNFEHIRRDIEDQKHKKKHHLRCTYCNTPLYAKHQTLSKGYGYGFVHLSKATPNIDLMNSCPFYTNNSLFQSYCSEEENEWRAYYKYEVLDTLPKNINIKTESILNSHFVFTRDNDKNIRRKPDIYFEDIYNNKWAVEFFRSWITTTIVHEREQYFRNRGTNLLWLFPPEDSERDIFGCKSISDYIMYGSNKDALAILNTKHNRPSNNIFIFGESELVKSQKQNNLFITTVYPTISISTQNITLNRELVSIDELNLDPYHRLPYAIDTSGNIKTYRRDIAIKVARLRRAYHYTKHNNKCSDISVSIIDELKKVVFSCSDLLFLQSTLLLHVERLTIHINKYINKYQFRCENYHNRLKAAKLLLTFKARQNKALSYFKLTLSPTLELILQCDNISSNNTEINKVNHAYDKWKYIENKFMYSSNESYLSDSSQSIINKKSLYISNLCDDFLKKSKIRLQDLKSAEDECIAKIKERSDISNLLAMFNIFQKKRIEYFTKNLNDILNEIQYNCKDSNFIKNEIKKSNYIWNEYIDDERKFIILLNSNKISKRTANILNIRKKTLSDIYNQFLCKFIEIQNIIIKKESLSRIAIEQQQQDEAAEIEEKATRKQDLEKIKIAQEDKKTRNANAKSLTSIRFEIVIQKRYLNNIKQDMDLNKIQSLLTLNQKLITNINKFHTEYRKLVLCGLQKNTLEILTKYKLEITENYKKFENYLSIIKKKYDDIISLFKNNYPNITGMGWMSSYTSCYKQELQQITSDYSEFNTDEKKLIKISLHNFLNSLENRAHILSQQSNNIRKSFKKEILNMNDIFSLMVLSKLCSKDKISKTKIELDNLLCSIEYEDKVTRLQSSNLPQ